MSFLRRYPAHVVVGALCLGLAWANAARSTSPMLLGIAAAAVVKRGLFVALSLALLGWWWADPAAALVIAAIAAKEGREAWRGESCDCC